MFGVDPAAPSRTQGENQHDVICFVFFCCFPPRGFVISDSLGKWFAWLLRPVWGPLLLKFLVHSEAVMFRRVLGQWLAGTSGRALRFGPWGRGLGDPRTLIRVTPPWVPRGQNYTIGRPNKPNRGPERETIRRMFFFPRRDSSNKCRNFDQRLSQLIKLGNVIK